MRELMLKRIEELKPRNRDLFGKPNKKGKLPDFAKYPLDIDFSKFSDEELVNEFETFIYRCYRQR